MKRIMLNRLLCKIPSSYKDVISNVIKDAKKIYKENLEALFLAGSTGKGNCIEDWSDIDLYIITKKFDLKQNVKFYKKAKGYHIHVGTTFYTVDMISRLEVDQKTKVAFYEYKNYSVNGFIYGDINIPNIEFKDLIDSEKSLNDLIQTVLRELYNYQIDKKNIKTLIKKTTLLIKVYLETKRHLSIFNYPNVFKTFNKCEKIENNYNICDIIKNNDSDDILIDIVKNILIHIIEGRNDFMKRVSARGLVVTDKGLAVIFRRKVNESGVKEYYVIPGGGVEEGEEITQGLKRELREELDIEVNIKDLAFVKESEDRIEYFYNCEFVSGNFKLNGEEIDRMSDSNYYEPTFIELKDLNNCDIVEEVKDYFNK